MYTYGPIFSRFYGNKRFTNGCFRSISVLYIYDYVVISIRIMLHIHLRTYI